MPVSNDEVEWLSVLREMKERKETRDGMDLKVMARLENEVTWQSTEGGKRNEIGLRVLVCDWVRWRRRSW